MTPREGQLCLLIRHTGWQGIVREVPLLYWNLKLQIREMAGHVFHDGQTSHCPTWNTDFSLEFILKIYQYEKLAEVIELWWALRGKKVSSLDFLSLSYWPWSFISEFVHTTRQGLQEFSVPSTLPLTVYIEYSLKHRFHSHTVRTFRMYLTSSVLFYTGDLNSLQSPVSRRVTKKVGDRESLQSSLSFVITRSQSELSRPSLV